MGAPARVLVLALTLLLTLAPAQAGTLHQHQQPNPHAPPTDDTHLATAQQGPGNDSALNLSTPADAQQAIQQAGYPLPADPTERFANFTQRTELAPPGDVANATRVMRFAHVTDLQLVDDDAPAPLRVAQGDPVFNATISGSAERPQEEYADEILHAMIDVLNQHNELDEFQFAIHTGDNIDNALENELMRYIDLVEGTHTTTGPLTGLQCQPDGQSENVDDDANNVEDACTSLPTHLVDHVRGLAPNMTWYSLNGNHDTLIQGNVNVEPGFNDIAAQHGRHFLYPNEYVAMHFDNLDPCTGGTPTDDFGHGYGYAGDRLCDEDEDNNAYYAFDHQGARIIALDTVNDEVYQSNENASTLPFQDVLGEQNFVAGASAGAIDQAQFNWLKGQLENHTDQPILLFAHHTVNAFYNSQFDPACGPPGCANDAADEAGFITREDMKRLLGQHPNVQGYFGGHTHQHRVTIQSADNAPSPGYWNIETSGLLDMPQETRIVEVWITDNGTKGFLALDPIGHIFQKAQQLAQEDPDHDGQAAAGEAKDRRTLLWFNINTTHTFQPGHQPPITNPQPLDLALLQPTQTNDNRTITPGNHTLNLQALEANTTTPIPDLEITYTLRPNTPTHANGLNITSTTGTNGTLTPIGDGTYQTTIHVTQPGDHTLTLNATHPDGAYQPTEETYTLTVQQEDAESQQDAPLSALLLLLTFLGVALHRRRR